MRQTLSPGPAYEPLEPLIYPNDLEPPTDEEIMEAGRRCAIEVGGG